MSPAHAPNSPAHPKTALPAHHTGEGPRPHLLATAVPYSAALPAASPATFQPQQPQQQHQRQQHPKQWGEGAGVQEQGKGRVWGEGSGGEGVCDAAANSGGDGNVDSGGTGVCCGNGWPRGAGEDDGSTWAEQFAQEEVYAWPSPFCVQGASGAGGGDMPVREIGRAHV